MIGTYLIYDRLFYLSKSNVVSKKTYCQQYEISNRAFFRDLEHLKLFYDIEFRYDRAKNLYIRWEKNERL